MLNIAIFKVLIREAESTKKDRGEKKTARSSSVSIGRRKRSGKLRIPGEEAGKSTFRVGSELCGG